MLGVHKDTVLFHLIQVLDIVSRSLPQVLPAGSFSLHQLHKELISSPNLHLGGLGWEQYRQHAPSTSRLFLPWLYAKNCIDIFKKKKKFITETSCAITEPFEVNLKGMLLEKETGTLL